MKGGARLRLDLEGWCAIGPGVHLDPPKAPHLDPPILGGERAARGGPDEGLLERGARGGERGCVGARGGREGARGSKQILTWTGGERGREGVGRRD